MEIAEGSMFGRYRVVRQIGRGGMGAVYEAVHSDLEKRVALKVLLPSTASQTELVARFEREARAAARVRHPNVVDVSDVGVEAGVAWLVMEHLEGEDLSGLLRREGALPLSRVAELMLPVLGAVEAAHSLGVVHRDLKPENIFLARMRDGTIVPKVLDFGISKMAPAGGGPALTSTGIMDRMARMTISSESCMADLQQSLRVMIEVIVHEGRNKVVAVIVARMSAQHQRLTE